MKVLVLGDTVRHRPLYCSGFTGDRVKPMANILEQVQVEGAPTLARLLAAAANGNPEMEITTAEWESAAHLPTLYSEFRPSDGSPSVWRLHRELGLAASELAADAAAIEGLDTPDVLVLQDMGQDFRNLRWRQTWPHCLQEGYRGDLPEHLVLEHAGPVCQGDLWRSIQARLGDRTVVVTSIEELRRESVRVSLGLSWEQTATDLREELLNNPALAGLLSCRAVVICLGCEGALIVEGAASGHRAELLFDPSRQFEEWHPELNTGTTRSLRAVTAAIALGLAHGADFTGLCAAVAHGLSAMRTELLLGHGPVDGAHPAYPAEEVAADLSQPSVSFAHSSIPLAVSGPCGLPWSILAASAGELDGPLYGLAMRAALTGHQALQQVPCEQFGAQFTVDRQEIESLRNIRRLIRDYAASPSESKPLSLAVFGPPGCGKSFTVKQLAKSALPKGAGFLEFNLSQFVDEKDLIGAFHQVRDIVLAGGVPLIFWDEFDSRSHFWLQYLLAPMQDGAFQEGQVTHAIGKCIFVFAGGTSYDFQNFGPPPNTDPDDDVAKAFRLAKGPDFRSRISGFLNILGPNRRQMREPGQSEWQDCPEDNCFPVRRAILLRGLLRLGPTEPLEIDLALLRALLEIGRFEHGIRSMEKIVSAVRQASPGKELRRSAIPQADEISLYVDGDAFLAIVDRDLLFQKDAEKIAPAIHAFYVDHMKISAGEAPFLIPFDELPAGIMEDNLAAARRISEVLSLAGLEITTDPDAVGTESACQRQLEDNLEALAEAEHDGWMDGKLRNGWRLGARDDAQCIHPSLIPYRDLPEIEKEKDRDGVLTYAQKLALAGYRIKAKA